MTELIKALVAARKDIGAAKKGAVNPHFKSKYADLASVIDAVKEPLEAHGLAFVQDIADGSVVTVILHGGSGETLRLAPFPIMATKQDAQGMGSGLTYARRYSLQTALGVPSEDDDGNAASRPPEPKFKGANQDALAREIAAGAVVDQARVQLVADALRLYLGQPGKEWNIFEECEALEDAEKMALWAILTAGERSKIKKVIADCRAAQSETVK